MKTRRAVALLVLLCLAFASGQAGLDSSGSMSPEHNVRAAQRCGYDPQLSIFPVLPAKDDAIQITSSGVWPDSCIPLYQSHQIVDHVITIDALIDYPGALCFYVLTGWEFTVDVGPLPSGPYRIDVYTTDLIYDPFPSSPCITKSFTVSEGFQSIYLPIVAKEL